MAHTYDERGKVTRTISERKKLAQLGPDYEIEREILEARQNKKAKQDAGMDMLLDAIKKKNKKVLMDQTHNGCKEKERQSQDGQTQVQNRGTDSSR